MAFLYNWFVKITGFIPQWITLRIKVYYEDKSKQSRKIRGKAIVISNHITVMDFAVMMFVFLGRTLRCVTAEILYTKNIFLTWFLNLAGAIKVDRNVHDFDFISKCKKILDKGGVVEIYPEARIPDKSEQRPIAFKPSAVYLALESQAPIIPIYTTGPRYFERPTRVIIGCPIDVFELYDDDLSEKENIEIITKHLHSVVLGLKEKLESIENQEERKK